MIIKINGIWYISVKGTAKSYNVNPRTIRNQIDNNLNIFTDNHVKTTGTLEKKFPTYFTNLERKNPKKQWLDKFAFYKVGTLLNP